MKAPAIVLPAYDRPESLNRLLTSLSRASYPEASIPLIISLDKTEVHRTRQIAEAFQWPHGEKIILDNPQHLGLKAHILQCGDLTQEYESVILLEDDLVVSPYFYQFAWEALNEYETEPAIGGISLYAYEITENGFSPFQPLADGKDVYFLQFPSSWGQAWTCEQWQAFRTWFQSHPEVSPGEKIPQFLSEWPESSWKKHYARYLLAQDLFFVYPKVSHTTNFSDPGTHADTAALFQVPLQLAAQSYQFIPLSTSGNRYDVFFELLPEALRLWAPELPKVAFTVDLYGQKDPEFWQGPYLLTARSGSEIETHYGKKMFPPVLNFLYKIKGRGIHWLKAVDAFPDPIQPSGNYYRWAAVAPQLLDKAAPSHMPEVSLVIPIHAAQANINLPALPQGVSLEIILVHQEPLEKGFVPPSAAWDQTRTVECAPGASIYEMIEKGLTHCTGKIMGILPQGSILQPQAIKKLAVLFRDFEQVKWISGQPLHAKRISPLVRLSTQRILLEKAPNIPFAKWQRLLPFGQVFWRRTLWEKTGGRFRSELGTGAPLDLWARFWQQAPPTLTKQSWSAKVLSPGYLHPEKIALPDSLKRIQQLKRKEPGPLRRGVAALFRPFFNWNVPGIRFAYYELAQLPDVLIFDPTSDKYYFWRY